MEINPQTIAIVKAIAHVESGGKLSDLPKEGQSGEMASVFQFTPSTWKLYSKQMLGQEAPLTRENESAVVYGKVQNWIDSGFTVEEIASMWNAGERKPDAYKENWKGVNKKGVSFDTPAYAKKVRALVDEFSKKGGTKPAQPSQNPMQSSPNPTQAPPQFPQIEQAGSAASAPTASSGMMQSLMNNKS